MVVNSWLINHWNGKEFQNVEWSFNTPRNQSVLSFLQRELPLKTWIVPRIFKNLSMNSKLEISSSNPLLSVHHSKQCGQLQFLVHVPNLWERHSVMCLSITLYVLEGIEYDSKRLIWIFLQDVRRLLSIPWNYEHISARITCRRGFCYKRYSKTQQNWHHTSHKQTSFWI
jgi:hypothetical protein